MKEKMMTKTEIVEAVSRGWGSEKNKHKEMDPILAEAIAEEIWKANLSSNLGHASTRELLDEVQARVGAHGLAEYKTSPTNNFFGEAE